MTVRLTVKDHALMHGHEKARRAIKQAGNLFISCQV
jgi:hypothetical protein